MIVVIKSRTSPIEIQHINQELSCLNIKTKIIGEDQTS